MALQQAGEKDVREMMQIVNHYQNSNKCRCKFKMMISVRLKTSTAI